MTATQYMVLRCSHCGQLQTKMVKSVTTYTFKCVYCLKSTKLKKISEFGLTSEVLYKSDNPHEAAKACIKLKENEGKKNGI